MGGVAGHLMHLYDDREMTFNKMKKILSLASNGQIEGTEKTDGYNIFLGVKDGQPRAARNKGDMAKGGMTAEELAARDWAGGEAVRQVYIDSFRAFSKAVNSLSPEETSQIFGPAGEIFIIQRFKDRGHQMSLIMMLMWFQYIVVAIDDIYQKPIQ